MGFCCYEQRNGLKKDAAYLTADNTADRAAADPDTSDEPLTIDALLQLAGGIAMPAMADFMQPSGDQTHGEDQFMRFGLAGIRGEAASGFRSLTEVGLPAFYGGLEQGLSCNDAGVGALLAMIARVDDSNMIARGGMKLAGELKAQIAELLEHPWNTQTVEALDDLFIQLNVSPGGCADLLALVYFLDLL